jgi:hypothetical protein
MNDKPRGRGAGRGDFLHPPTAKARNTPQKHRFARTNPVMINYIAATEFLQFSVARTPLLPPRTVVQ